jgi:hypothetical protein
MSWLKPWLGLKPDIWTGEHGPLLPAASYRAPASRADNLSAQRPERPGNLQRKQPSLETEQA